MRSSTSPPLTTNGFRLCSETSRIQLRQTAHRVKKPKSTATAAAPASKNRKVSYVTEPPQVWIDRARFPSRTLPTALAAVALRRCSARSGRPHEWPNQPATRRPGQCEIQPTARVNPEQIFQSPDHRGLKLHICRPFGAEFAGSSRAGCADILRTSKADRHCRSLQMLSADP